VGKGGEDRRDQDGVNNDFDRRAKN